MIPTEYEIIQQWNGNIDQPLVSICCITYNHEEFIAEALDSFLMQKTDFPFEIVISDDFSTDGTTKIIQKYVNEFPNIFKAQLRTKNVGMVTNGIETTYRTKGQYIAYCEGDDYWTDDNKLQYQIDRMKENEQCFISMHPVFVQKNNADQKSIRNQVSEQSIQQPMEVLFATKCQTSSFIIKRELLSKIPLAIAKRGMSESVLQFFGALHGGALMLTQPMSLYRVHNGGLHTSSSRNVEYIENDVINLIAILDEIDSETEQKFQPEIPFLIENTIEGFIKREDFPFEKRIAFYSQHAHYLDKLKRSNFLLEFKKEAVKHKLGKLYYLDGYETNDILKAARCVKEIDLALTVKLLHIVNKSRPNPEILKEIEKYEQHINQKNL